MKNAIFGFILGLCSLEAFAYTDDPRKLFPANQNSASEALIAWRTANNVQAECEAESKKRGIGGFGYSVAACSFWSKSGSYSVCTIITAKSVDLTTLGHETRHCFQGGFH